uniref:Uncharacterized protein n=1 Tax=Timema genevievae TaxID=629358 RepID=A0A7R9JN85_TIMGE|nr:unnamed protein product [Timema genevievae]
MLDSEGALDTVRGEIAKDPYRLSTGANRFSVERSLIWMDPNELHLFTLARMHECSHINTMRKDGPVALEQASEQQACFSNSEKNYQAKLYCENYLKRTGVRLDMRPYLCGNACKCCGCRTVDAIEYYSEEESRLRGALEDERTTALKRPLGIAFVTLMSTEAARKMYADHRPTCKCENNPSSSSVSRHLEPHRWQVSFAPSPKDLFWENLSLPSKYWYVKAVISAVVSEFLPTLLLWTVSALMPVLVSYSDRFLSHWTRSEQNHSIMNKTFTLLLFMVLILPSLGLTRPHTSTDPAYSGVSFMKSSLEIIQIKQLELVDPYIGTMFF